MVGWVHLRITGLSVSDTEPGVYHDCSPSRTAHMCRISDTAHVPVLYVGHNRISDIMLMPIRSTGFAAWSVDSICPISVSEIRSESYGDDMAE